MSYETDLIALLMPVANNEAYWLKTPDGHAQPDTGWLIVQQVGGAESWYMDRSRPGFTYARVQIAAWSPDMLTTINLMRSARNAIAQSAFTASPVGNAIDQDQLGDVGLFGRFQHFGIWYPDP